jgi:hypothetical protein
MKNGPVLACHQGCISLMPHLFLGDLSTSDIEYLILKLHANKRRRYFCTAGLKGNAVRCRNFDQVQVAGRYKEQFYKSTSASLHDTTTGSQVLALKCSRNKEQSNQSLYSVSKKVYPEQ